MTIKPLLDKVVLKLDDAEQTTASGIVLALPIASLLHNISVVCIQSIPAY